MDSLPGFPPHRPLCEAPFQLCLPEKEFHVLSLSELLATGAGYQVRVGAPGQELRGQMQLDTALGARRTVATFPASRALCLQARGTLGIHAPPAGWLLSDLPARVLPSRRQPLGRSQRFA